MNRINTVSLRGGRGFTLIEALIGLVILSVGLLSVVALQTELISSTGQTKARTEAMQIAEREMEALRNFIIRETQAGIHTFEDIATATLPDEVGTNANFEVEREVGLVGDPDLLRVSVEVAWTDPKDGALSVDLESFIGWDDVSAGARSAAPAAIDPGSLLNPPTGRARQGGRDYDGLPDPDVDGGSLTQALDGFGAYVYESPDGLTELMDSDGRVLLTVDSGEAFSSISGTFYTTEDLDPQATRVTASDASACLQTAIDADGNMSQPDGENYSYYRYRCWVGPAWYGNIGVVRSEGAHNNDRTCVGDPGVASVDTFDSTHPVMSAVRVYRGFKDVDMADFESVGIGVYPDPVTGDNLYTEQHYAGHDFMLSRFGGNSMDNDSCADVMASSTFDPAPAENFDGNAGYGVCLNKGANGEELGDVLLCDEAPLVPPDPTTTITYGLLSFDGDERFNKVDDAFDPTMDYAAEMDGQGCALENNAGSARLVCNVTRTGWSGDAWEGQLTLFLNSGVTLCDVDATYLESQEATVTHGETVIDFEAIPANELEISIGVSIITEGEGCPTPPSP